MKDIDRLFSKNANNMKRSVIRELLKLTTQPNIISFAGGLPAPSTFPVEDLKDASARVFEKYSASALQYGATEGDVELKKEIIKFEEKEGNKLTPDKLLIVSASQQALDLAAKVFLDPDDIVIVGRPTYVGAIGTFNSYRGKIIGIPFSPEDDGMDMDALRTTVNKAGKGGKIKFIYVIPDFQNPSGICWSLQKREELLDIAYEFGLLIIEDSPYREIRFMGDPVPSIYSMDTEDQVICLKTFSKILVPGTRLGWVMAPETIISKFVMAKQAMDLCTNTLGQKMMAEYMKTGKLEQQIKNTIKLYGRKRECMLNAMDREMPKRPDITWTKPEGGLFLWLRLPEFINTDELFHKAVAENVAYVVGSAFYGEHPEMNAMRINFSYSSFEEIEEGVKRLAKVIKEELGD